MLGTLLTLFKRTAPVEDLQQPSSTALPGAAPLVPCVPGVDCEDCPNRAVHGPTLPLCLVKQGARARIVAVDEPRRFRKRLADLGLAAGMEVRVLQAPRGSGPMILAVRNDARLAIRWELANKIRVQIEA